MTFYINIPYLTPNLERNCPIPEPQHRRYPDLTIQIIIILGRWMDVDLLLLLLEKSFENSIEKIFVSQIQTLYFLCVTSCDLWNLECSNGLVGL